MRNDNSSPRISNTVFKGGTGAFYGGAVANVNQSAPVFTNCRFENAGVRKGGGVCYNDQSAPQFIRCWFNNSKAGGVFHNINHSKPKIVNSVASGNSVMLHLQNLSPGLYIIRVTGVEGEKRQFKFIKE